MNPNASLPRPWERKNCYFCQDASSRYTTCIFVIKCSSPKATNPNAEPAATAYPSLSSTLSPPLLRPISPCRKLIGAGNIRPCNSKRNSTQKKNLYLIGHADKLPEVSSWLMHVLNLHIEVQFPLLLLTGSIENGASIRTNGYVISHASSHVKLAQVAHFRKWPNTKGLPQQRLSKVIIMNLYATKPRQDQTNKNCLSILLSSL